MRFQLRRRLRHWLATSLVVSAGLAAPAVARAQDSVPPPDAPRLNLATLRNLHLTLLPAGAAQTKKEKSILRFDNGYPEIRSGGVRIGFRARVQYDKESSDAPLPDAKEQDTIADVAKKRVGVDGRLWDAVEFQIEYELGKTTTSSTIGPDPTETTLTPAPTVTTTKSPWRDVYFNIRQLPEVEVQVGRFKIPFSMDENTSPTNNDFVNRSLAAMYLSPGRDQGFMVHGRVGKKIVRYEFGIFQHDGDNAKSSNPERVLAGRTTAFRIGADPGRNSSSPLSDVWIGVAFTKSDIPEGYSSVRGKTVFGSEIYSLKYYVKGQRERMGLEGRWRPGPVSVKAEYIRSTDTRVGESVEDTDLPRLRTTAWYISGSFALTGERKMDGLDAPKHPFLQGGIGAVEIAARIENLRFDSDAAGTETPSKSPRAAVPVGNSERAFTFGVSWYLNHWVKIQYNIIKETLTDPSLGPFPSKPSFMSRVLRFQFTL